MGRDRVVGIAIRYELDGQGIKFRREARFSTYVQTGPRAHQPPMQWVPVLSRGSIGRSVGLPTHMHLAPMLKKEKSYTSTPPLGIRGLLEGELYIYRLCVMLHRNLRRQ